MCSRTSQKLHDDYLVDGGDAERRVAAVLMPRRMTDSAKRRPTQGDHAVLTSDRRIVLVLGPGRSGTSTMAGMLAMSGFDVPRAIGVSNARKAERAGKQANPLGYYEPRWVVDFHRDLLHSVKVSTLETDPDVIDRVATVAATPEVRRQMRTWLRKRLARHHRLVIKDPRLVYFGDLWVGVAQELGEDPGFVFMLRHPSEVSSSRSEFYETPAVSSVAGWVNVALMTEQLTRGSPRALVHYSRLTADWRAEATRVRDLLGLHLEPGPEVSPHPVDSFIDPALRRRSPGWEESRVPTFLQELGETTFVALGDLAERGDSAETFARLDDLCEQYRTLHSAALDLANTRIQRERAPAEAPRTARATAQRRTGGPQQAELDRLRRRVDQLESSWIPGAARRRISGLRRRLRGRSRS